MHGTPIVEIQDDIAPARVGMLLQDAFLQQEAYEFRVGDEAIEALLEVAQSDGLVLFKLWDRSRRFWTDRNFSGADALCQTTKSRLTSLDLDSPASEAAMRKLEANCPAG